jgi:hypothetical protein
MLQEAHCFDLVPLGAADFPRKMPEFLGSTQGPKIQFFGYPDPSRDDFWVFDVFLRSNTSN